MNAPHKTPGGQAVKRHRERLTQAGMARFEVKAPVADKDLIRRLAKALANGAIADNVRGEVEAALSPPPARTKGRILEALLNSPLVGADIDFTREPMPLRKVDF